MSYYGGNTSGNGRTSLGLPEPVERAGSYLFLWVSGLILLFVEKNPNVRHHARQSVFVFGTLGILGFLVGILHTFLAWVPLVGGLLGWLASGIWLLTGILWVVLIIAGALSPRFILPGSRTVQKLLV